MSKITRWVVSMGSLAKIPAMTAEWMILGSMEPLSSTRDDHRPGVIPLHPAAEIELFQDQTLILPVIVGQIFPYGPPDIQIPKGADWAAAGAVQLPQGRAPDLMLHFFGQLLYHPRHDPPGGIQYRPLHHTLQTEDHFQQRPHPAPAVPAPLDP